MIVVTKTSDQTRQRGHTLSTCINATRTGTGHSPGDRGMFIFPVQLTTSRIGNLTRLIHTLLYVMTIHTYIHTRIDPPRVCVCVFFPFILEIKFVGRTSRGHTGFLIHLFSAVRALIFLARRIQSFLSVVDREVEFCVLTI